MNKGKLKRYLWDFFTSKEGRNLLSDTVRINLIINFFGFVGFSSLLYFFIKSINNSQFLFSGILLVYLIFTVFSLVFQYFSKSTKITGHLIVIIMLSLNTFLLFTSFSATVNNNFVYLNGLYTLIIPGLSLFILGIRKGSIYIILQFLILSLAFYFPTKFSTSFPDEFKFKLFFILIVISLLTYFYEYVRSRTNSELKLEVNKSQILLEQVKSKNTQIDENIDYAANIQKTFLPSKEYLDNTLIDYFVFFQPKDKVSGDFYFVKENNNKLLIAVVDCTGHGVSGAFISIIAHTLLQRYSFSENYESAAEYLDFLRVKMIEKLGKKNHDFDFKEGMDMSLLIIDRNQNNANFAGSYQSLYFINDNELKEYKGDKMTVGASIKPVTSGFTDYFIEYNMGDSFYMTTDGYINQLGKFFIKKYTSKQFKQKITDINKLDFITQGVEFEKEFNKWKGDKEQVDDVLVIGIRV